MLQLAPLQRATSNDIVAQEWIGKSRKCLVRQHMSFSKRFIATGCRYPRSSEAPSHSQNRGVCASVLKYHAITTIPPPQTMKLTKTMFSLCIVSNRVRCLRDKLEASITGAGRIILCSVAPPSTSGPRILLRPSCAHQQHANIEQEFYNSPSSLISAACLFPSSRETVFPSILRFRIQWHYGAPQAAIICASSLPFQILKPCYDAQLCYED